MDFQTGEQATLLLVEQAVEDQNGGFEYIGRYLESGRIGHQRNRLRGLLGADLIPSPSANQPRHGRTISSYLPTVKAGIGSDVDRLHLRRHSLGPF
jgi:hypothetical protein